MFIGGSRCPNTVLWCPFTDMNDHSGRGHVLTPAGDAAISTAVTDPWGGNRGVLALDGTGDYVSTPAAADLALGTGDFAAWAWVYPTAVPSNYVTIVGRVSGTGGGWEDIGWSLLFWNTQKLYFQASNAGGAGVTVSSTGTLSLNTWAHVAVVRASGVTKLYINGSQDGESSTAWSCLDTFSLYVGWGYFSGEYFSGRVSDVLLVSGRPYAPSASRVSGPLVGWNWKV